MERSTKIYFIEALFVLLIVISCISIVVIMHENAHQVIYYYNGIDSHVEYLSKFPDVVTIPEEPCPDKYCELAQANVDAFGYHLIALTFVGLTIWAIMYMRNVSKELIEGDY